MSAIHFDAHPDLMVTPEMPAETCFRPQELYDTLAAAEGGIAEWILPLVYQVSLCIVVRSSQVNLPLHRLLLLLHLRRLVLFVRGVRNTSVQQQ